MKSYSNYDDRKLYLCFTVQQRVVDLAKLVSIADGRQYIVD